VPCRNDRRCSGAEPRGRPLNGYSALAVVDRLDQGAVQSVVSATLEQKHFCQYRFVDFVRFGLPLNLILWAAASFLIPWFWPVS